MKKFILCIFMASGLMMVSNYAESATIDYNQAVKLGRKSMNKKPVRMIIREILDRKKIEKMEREFDELKNTIPIPLYDSIDHDRFKNLA